MMTIKNMISPEDQTVSFVELFFDLVFVFSVTQVVGILHHEFHGTVVVQSILVFWLIWWAWTQFTWTLNAADTTHPLIDFGTLFATAVAFFMAVVVPEAFGHDALWFAITYIIVRLIGLTLNYLVASTDASQRAAVRTFLLLSCVGFVIIFAGAYLGGQWQLWLWATAIVFDIVTVLIAGTFEGWNVHPEHFAERHGLFVIIALGESLIVAASSVSGTSLAGPIFVVALLAVAITCALWWTYFPRAKPVLEHSLESNQGVNRTQIARDSYSLMHFVMLMGIIGFAFAVEEGLAHPSDPMAIEARLSLSFALIAFVGGMALAIWRAKIGLLLPRLGLIIGTALAVYFVSQVTAGLSLAIAFVGILIIIFVEQRTLLVPAE
jgi:low temperature requirement protein LtrA